MLALLHRDTGIELMTSYEERLLRKQARLTQKLERIKAKLADRASLARGRRVRAPRDPNHSGLRGLVYLMAFSGFWWLGRSRINGFLDEFFGHANPAPAQQPVTPGSTHETFWTFGRRRRSGDSQIRPVS
jgi:hypothetical protein